MTDTLERPGDADADDELPVLHVGDHVRDRDADDAPLVVTGLPLQRAATYDIGDDLTVADVNADYPETAHVVEVVYADRTDAFLDEQPTYAFPRPRLQLVTPLHERDDDQGGDR